MTANRKAGKSMHASILLGLLFSTPIFAQDLKQLTDHKDTTVRKNARELKQLSSLFTWKNSTGKFDIRAQYFDYDFTTDSVILRKTNAKKITVQISQLGDEEQKRVRRILALKELLAGILLESLNEENKRLSDELKSVHEKLNSNNAEIEALRKEIASLKPIELKNADEYANVTVARLKALGTEFHNKKIKLTNASFTKVSNSFLHFGVLKPRTSQDGFVEFGVEQRVSFLDCYLSKGNKKELELVLEMKRGEKVNIYGEYFMKKSWAMIIVHKIEVVKRK